MTIEKQVAGLWCHEVADHLEAHVADRLAPDLRAQVEAHLQECQHCASFGARYAALVQRVKESVAGSAAEDAALTERLRKKVDALE